MDVLHTGSYLQLVRDGRWEHARRVGNSGVVAVVAITEDDCILLVEQYRYPVDRRVIELPAGLAGDHTGTEDEHLVEAAKRELIEESGYVATDWRELGAFPTSAGLTNETYVLFEARGLTRQTAGGGDASEEIDVSVVPLSRLRAVLGAAMAEGKLVDPKIGHALWAIGRV